MPESPSDEKHEDEDKKKYPCIYGLKEHCLARRFVEESLTHCSPEAQSEEAKMVEDALKDSKAIRFDDEKTAHKLGEDIGRSIMGPIIQATRPCAAQMMGGYCGMCPRLHEENAKYMPSIGIVRPMSPGPKPGDSVSEKKDEP